MNSSMGGDSFFFMLCWKISELIDKWKYKRLQKRYAKLKRKEK